MQLDVTIIVILLVTIGLTIGYYLGSNNDYSLKRKEPLTLDDMRKLFEKAQAEEEEARQPHAPDHTKSKDIINHEGVGIVYRPTSEELEKMHEPEKVKQAKEAIAETLKQAKEPAI